MVLGVGKQIGSEEVWEEIIKEVDTNGDGDISFEEFEIMMKKILINNNEE
jgi:Ca2+-binding EF-hand superfamily protein